MTLVSQLSGFKWAHVTWFNVIPGSALDNLARWGKLFLVPVSCSLIIPVYIIRNRDIVGLIELSVLILINHSSLTNWWFSKGFLIFDICIGIKVIPSPLALWHQICQQSKRPIADQRVQVRHAVNITTCTTTCIAHKHLSTHATRHGLERNGQHPSTSC